MSLVPGTKLGPYEIQSLLGVGGMGEVYCARDVRLQRTVAIKILPSHMSSNPDLHARFEQEAKSISGLRHSNICVLHDVGSQDGVDYMVMEYIAGQTLDKLIPAGGLVTNVVLKYAVQIAEALSSTHAAGIVHRDLKPANIMVDETGVVKVLDFGLAKLDSSAFATDVEPATLATTPGIILGTVAYMFKQPVLMLNGHYDFFFPVESTQELFYRLLGSRKDQKKHLLYETGHNIPRNELIKESLNWLDHYLGPVN